MTTILERTEDVRAVRAALDVWAAAMAAKDTGGVLEQLTHDCVQFSLAPPLIAEEDLSGEGLARWFAGWDGPLGFDQHGLVIETGGDIALAHGLTNLRAVARGGERVDLWFRQTLGLRREGGRWRISHSHESVPFYMDGSFKAAVDLRP